MAISEEKASHFGLGPRAAINCFEAVLGLDLGRSGPLDNLKWSDWSYVYLP